MILTKCNIKEINLDTLIDSKIDSSKLYELLIIVPTNRKVRYLKRELISASPGQAASSINIETIGTFSSKLLLGSTWQNLVISDEAAIVLLKQCFDENELVYFSNYKGDVPFGTLERIKNVISEYKKHGITPEDLMREAANLSGADKLKAEDISKIYKQYNEKFTQLNVKEIGDVYKSINELDHDAFVKLFCELFAEVSTIVINGFDEFTFPELEIINSIAEIEGADLFLNFDYFNYNPALFSHLDKCYKNLEEKGFKTVRDKSILNNKPFVEDVKEKLFIKSVDEKSKNYKSKIKQISALNREKEIALIAKEMKLILQQKNIDPNKICVAFNLIKPYSQIIRNQFDTYGIPYNLTDRYSVNTSLPVIAIINLLEIIVNDFYYKNIFRSLSNNFIQFGDVDLNNLLKASVDLKIISGLKIWKDRLTASISEEQITGEFNDYKRYDVNYEKALLDINSIYNRLQSFNILITPAKFYKNLQDLIAKLNIHTAVLKAEDEIAEKDIKGLTTFLGRLRELIHLFELEFGTEKKLPLKFYLNQLITLASFSRYNIKEQHGYGVQVTTLNEIRGLKFDYLFIAGLSDGDLPTRFSPEIFFSGSFARQELQHQVEERYLFYQALCSWDKALYFTKPLTDGRKELVESSFLQEFKKHFEITNIDTSAYADMVSSKIELQKHIGENIESGDDDLVLPENCSSNLQDIKKSVEINQLRLKDPQVDSEYTGVLPDNINEHLKQGLEDFKNKQYSITQLESYAKCPYQYFVERVLKLNTIDEPTEELEAFEFGSLLHNILYEFYYNLKNMGIMLTGADDKDFAKAENLLFNTAEDKIESLNLNLSLSFFEKEKLLGVNGNRKNSLLYLFLCKERESEEGFVPQYFEMSFGKKVDEGGKESLSGEELKIGDVKLRGKIDRVDISEEENMFKVIDYKLSGKRPTKNDILTGLSLQLPLYLYVAKELIKSQLNKEIDPYGAEIYSFKYDESDFGPKLVRIDNSRSKEKGIMVPMAEEMMKICLDSINHFVENIVSGKFNLSKLKERENKVCRFCNFKSICRIQEIN
ncbi:MAG: PD-(D/E)XK nuclease family protein [Ignavibacteria bacterium]|jgi:ATP-dependent helicase/nuclease subunit B